MFVIALFHAPTGLRFLGVIVELVEHDKQLAEKSIGHCTPALFIALNSFRGDSDAFRQACLRKRHQLTGFGNNFCSNHEALHSS